MGRSTCLFEYTKRERAFTVRSCERRKINHQFSVALPEKGFWAADGARANSRRPNPGEEGLGFSRRKNSSSVFREIVAKPIAAAALTAKRSSKKPSDLQLPSARTSQRLSTRWKTS